MADGNKMAEKAFNEFIKRLNKLKWNYSTGMANGNHVIRTGVQGDDVPIELHFVFDRERELTLVFSQLPTALPKEKIIEGAAAVAMMNHNILQGCFDLNTETGEIVFRLVDDWTGGFSDGNVCENMLGMTCQTVDRYNDKLIAFAEGKISRDELFAFVRAN